MARCLAVGEYYSVQKGLLNLLEESMVPISFVLRHFTVKVTYPLPLSPPNEEQCYKCLYSSRSQSALLLPDIAFHLDSLGGM